MRELDLGIRGITVSKILTADLGMKCVAANFFPRSGHKTRRNFAQVAQQLLEISNNDPDFLKNVIARGESWIYGYYPETKTQSSRWKSPGCSGF